jgi:hypothetical protein
MWSFLEHNMSTPYGLVTQREKPPPRLRFHNTHEIFPITPQKTAAASPLPIPLPVRNSKRGSVILSSKRMRAREKKKQKREKEKLQKEKEAAALLYSSSFPHPCTACTARFSTAWNMRRHYRSVHSTLKIRYFCDFPSCGKTFSTKEDVVPHRALHPIEKPAICNRYGCHFSNVSLAVLENHKKRDHKGAPYVCKIKGCVSEKFKSERQLEQHRQSCHSLSELYYNLWSPYKKNKPTSQKRKRSSSPSQEQVICKVRAELRQSVASHTTPEFVDCSFQPASVHIPIASLLNDGDKDTESRPPSSSFSSSQVVLQQTKGGVVVTNTGNVKKIFHCPSSYCHYSTPDYPEFVEHQIQRHCPSSFSSSLQTTSTVPITTPTAFCALLTAVDFQKQQQQHQAETLPPRENLLKFPAKFIYPRGFICA